MKPEMELLERIDGYLLGEMSPEEIVVFEKEMASDLELSRLVALQTKANQLVVGNKLKVLKDIMDRDFSAGRVESNSGNGRWWLGLGILAGLTASTGLYFILNTSQKSERTILLEKPSVFLDTLIQNGEYKNEKQQKVLPKENNYKEAEKRSTVKQIENKKIIVVSVIDSVSPQLVIEPREIKKQEVVVLKETQKSSLEEKKKVKEEVLTPSTIIDKTENPSKILTMSFRPEFGEVAKIPLDPLSEVEVQILNRAGILQWKEVRVGEEECIWDGKNYQGGISPAGLYIYLLDYKNGRKETGQLILY